MSNVSLVGIWLLLKVTWSRGSSEQTETWVIAWHLKKKTLGPKDLVFLKDKAVSHFLLVCNYPSFLVLGTIRTAGSGTTQFGFLLWSCYFITVWCLISYLTALSLSFVVCKMRIDNKKASFRWCLWPADIFMDVNSFGRYVRESGKCELFSFTPGLFLPSYSCFRC